MAEMAVIHRAASDEPLVLKRTTIPTTKYSQTVQYHLLNYRLVSMVSDCRANDSRKTKKKYANTWRNEWLGKLVCDQRVGDVIRKRDCDSEFTVFYEPCQDLILYRFAYLNYCTFCCS